MACFSCYSQYNSKDTELYYLQSRYYDPQVGRFINSDTLVATGQGLIGNNMFAYCLNNPTNYFDDDGKDAIWLQEVEGSKNITITVIDSTQKETVYELKTDAEFLSQAMKEAEGLEFGADEGPYGLSVHTVNGERADYNLDGAYWGFNVNGTYCNYGVDSQPVMDGDAFEIVYTLAQ